MKNTFLLIALFFVLYACNTADKQSEGPDPEAVDLINQAQISDPDSALLLVNRALTIDSGYELAHYYKVNLLSQLERDEEALKAAFVYAQLDSFPLKNYMLVGRIYEKLEKLDSAIFYYDRALAFYRDTENAKGLSWVEMLDYPVMETVVNGRDSGLEVFKKLVAAEEHLTEQDHGFLQTIENEISQYQNGGLMEMLYNNDFQVFCVQTANSDSLEMSMLKQGINNLGMSKKQSDREWRVRVKLKFVEKALQLGYQKCQGQ